ncbi:MAG: Calcineurin-like protein phosphoesterase [Candidatus Gottesmanbacteria bacterium GW2011_GWC2_39_8]|uniref:Calcineurin-like protein phosphoesterase n=1 Tax=Candidatus Gottesmanbacteria bacterium GW2011_GWC2_39_8 TaxID=1618450 RepID=A0A0G0T4Q0_9BACT|nr:MAG: Calcineurin-like protein phosphoesterase [Candidatus Gottesmanbacteria bacterium GW2011_GWC2_39_8]
MIYAIISDVHSNLEALEAALKRINEIRVDEILCIGDIVGYNANPNECVEIIRDLGIKSIMGNHDRACAGLEEPTFFNEYAQEAVFWTRKHITTGNLNYLKSLEDSHVIRDELLIVHGSPRDPDEYIFGKQAAAENLRYLKKHYKNIFICFYGHTHVKALYALEEKPETISKSPDGIVLSKGVNFLINPGSIGQPRDNDPRSSFLIVDSEKLLIRYEAVLYDIEKTASKIIESGLPMFLAERLYVGR